MSKVKQIEALEAKTHLARLLRDTASGKSFIITQRGKPVAELRPVPPQKHTGVWGDMKGRIHMADDFCAPIDDMILYTIVPLEDICLSGISRTERR